MAIAVEAKPLDLSSEMRTFIGRHTDKSFDWDAFPGEPRFPRIGARPDALHRCRRLP